MAALQVQVFQQAEERVLLQQDKTEMSIQQLEVVQPETLLRIIIIRQPAAHLLHPHRVDLHLTHPDQAVAVRRPILPVHHLEAVVPQEVAHIVAEVVVLPEAVEVEAEDR